MTICWIYISGSGSYNHLYLVMGNTNVIKTWSNSLITLSNIPLFPSTNCSQGRLTCPGVTWQFCWCHHRPPEGSGRLPPELRGSYRGGWWRGSRAASEHEPWPSAPSSHSLWWASRCRSLRSRRSGCLCRLRREEPRWRWCLWADGQEERSKLEQDDIIC